MEKKEVKKVNGGFFRKPDIILYFVTALIIIGLFLFFVIIPQPEKNEGFNVLVDGRKIFSFTYETASYETYPYEQTDITVTVNEEGYIITVYLNQDKTEFNQLLVNVVNKKVSCIESTCSRKKDCVFSLPLQNGKGAIICMPHNLKVIPMGNGYIPVVSG